MIMPVDMGRFLVAAYCAPIAAWREYTKVLARGIR